MRVQSARVAGSQAPAREKISRHACLKLRSHRMLQRKWALCGAQATVLSLLSLPLMAQQLDRKVLPIPEPQPPTITELDARNATAPPRFSVSAPKGAPNVVVVLLDDIGFG